MRRTRATSSAPGRSQPLRNAGYNTKLVPLKGDLVRNVRSALQMLWGGVVFVVLIAAVNIANLSLVRANGPDEGAGDAQRHRRRRAGASPAARSPKRRC